MLSTIYNLFFPIYCKGCSTPWTYICTSCKKDLRAHPETCPNCHRPSKEYRFCLECTPYFRSLQWILIAFTYRSVIKRLIRELKYQHAYTVATFLAERLILLIQTHSVLMQAQMQQQLFITYVPSHRWKVFFKRGYNQSKLLAVHCSKYLSVPLLSLTKKYRYTRSQTTLSREQRKTNLMKTFSAKKTEKLMTRCVILIVDDITTTGSTIHEVAKVIKQSIPHATIRGVVVARHTT